MSSGNSHIYSDNNFMKLIPSVIYRGICFALIDNKFMQYDLHYLYQARDELIEYKTYFNGWMPFTLNNKPLTMAFSQAEITKIYEMLSNMAFEREVL